MKKRDNRYASHSMNISTEVFASLKPNCGLKGATDLHNWLPSCNSILWDAGNGRPFLRCLKLSAFTKTMSNWFKYEGITGSGETTPKEQVKCPSCGSYKTMPFSPKSISRTGGIAGIILGIILTMFFLWIIGVPLIAIGLLMLLSSFTVKETGVMKCNGCGFEFKKEK